MELVKPFLGFLGWLYGKCGSIGLFITFLVLFIILDFGMVLAAKYQHEQIATRNTKPSANDHNSSIVTINGDKITNVQDNSGIIDVRNK